MKKPQGGRGLKEDTRNKAVCTLKENGMKVSEIATLFKISEPRVIQIIKVYGRKNDLNSYPQAELA